MLLIVILLCLIGFVCCSASNAVSFNGYVVCVNDNEVLLKVAYSDDEELQQGDEVWLPLEAVGFEVEEGTLVEIEFDGTFRRNEDKAIGEIYRSRKCYL